MSDRELLEMAAKAAGIPIHVWGAKGSENIADMSDPSNHKLRNPLTDDGDALRLAVSVGIGHARSFSVEFDYDAAYVECGEIENYEAHHSDPYAADLRAIADAVDRGEILDLVAVYVHQDQYQFLYGTSIAYSVTLTSLLQQQALKRLREA